MIVRRKEKKSYGTGKIVEGVFEQGNRCLLIEDVITTGSSILETAEDVRKEGLLVEDALVLIDREQGAPATLLANGIRVHPCFTLSEILHERPTSPS
jgi:uridine monophosphate synthetase